MHEQHPRMSRLPHIVVLFVCVLAGCSSAPKPQRSGESRAATPAFVSGARIDAVPSSLIVVPIDPGWVFRPEEATTGVLDDGRRLTLRFFRVNTDSIAPFEARGPRHQGWLPTPAVWSVTSVEVPGTSAPVTTSTPVMAIEFPATPGGRFLDVAGKRWSVNWVVSPHDAIASSSLSREAQGESVSIWRPTLPPSGAVSPVFAAYSRPESLSPIGRWRYRMLTDGLAPPGAVDGVVPNPLAPFEEPIIEAIARQNEARWQSALAMLWCVDSDLAWRLKLRLTGVMDFGNGVVVPAWPTDHAILDLLLADLLDPGLSSPQRARRAAEWLEAQPPGLAWVADDAGIIDARKGVGVATIAIANLGERPTLSWVEAEGERREPDLRPAPAATVVRLPVSPVDDARPDRAPALVTAHLGKWRRELRAVTWPVPLTPPGLTIGPLLPDLTLDAWQQESGGRPIHPHWATVARLHSRTASAEKERTFELYVECRSAVGVDSDFPESEDAVRVWLGSASTPLAVLRVTSSGTLVDELVPSREQATIAIARTPTGWSFHVPLPRGAIERDGLVRLALTRTDGRGRRSAWPRAMLPWQREPSRIAVDTTTWSDAGREP